MAGRESAAVQAAVAAVLNLGLSVSEAARQNDCNVVSVRRALRRRDVPALPPVSGDKHPQVKAAEQRRLERLGRRVQRLPGH